MDKKEALKQIKAGNFSLQDADEKLKADKEVVLAAVKQSKWDLMQLKMVNSLEHADKKLKADKEVVLAAVKQDVSALEYVDDSLKNDPDILAIVNKDK